MKTFKAKFLLITVGNLGVGKDVNHLRCIIAIFRTQAKRKLGIIENFIILITVGHCLKKKSTKSLEAMNFFYIFDVKTILSTVNHEADTSGISLIRVNSLRP